MEWVSLLTPTPGRNQTFLVFLATHLNHSSRPETKPKTERTAKPRLLLLSKSSPTRASPMWYCKHLLGNCRNGRAPPSLPSSVLVLLLPSVVTVYSVSLRIGSFHFLFTTFDFSPLRYRTNFPNCHPAQSSASSDPLPSSLVPPAPSSRPATNDPRHWTHAALPLLYAFALPKPSESVPIHATSPPTEIQLALEALLTHTSTASIPQSHCQFPWKWNDPSEHITLCLTCNTFSIKIGKGLNRIPHPTHTHSLSTHNALYVASLENRLLTS